MSNENAAGPSQMETDDTEKSVKLGSSYFWLYKAITELQAMLATKTKQTSRGDLRFNISIGGALRSITYVARWSAAGKRAGNQMIMAMEKTGVRIESYVVQKSLTMKNVNELIKKIETAVSEKYTDWKPTTNNYGTVSQLMNFMTNFAYNFKVLQVGENSYMKRNQSGEVESVRISDYGFDINRHVQLAKGLQMKPIEASTQKTSLGYAATVVHYHQAPTAAMRQKWVPALEYHLTGLPRRSDIIEVVRRDDYLSKAVNLILGDIFLLIGDRAKHRYGLPPGYICGLLENEAGEFNENNINKLNFSAPGVLVGLPNFTFTVPDFNVDKIKFLILMAIFEGMYEDLGIMQHIADTHIFTRREVDGLIPKLRGDVSKTKEVKISLNKASKMRKAHGYELNLSSSSQLSSEPVFSGKRMRRVNDLKEAIRKEKLEFQSNGEIPDVLRGLYRHLTNTVNDEIVFGKAEWLSIPSLEPDNTVPAEIGRFYFSNVMDDN